MRIEHRDPTLKNPRAIHEEKRRLVLDWLLEFRFSSVDLLAYRLGSTPRHSYPFLRALLAQQLIQEAKSVASTNVRLFLLTRQGVDYLQVAGRDVSQALTRGDRPNRYAQVMHDLAVQASMLRRLQHYDEVIWDQHIRLPDPVTRPDALAHSPKDYWVAFEYERWRKADKRIYLSFRNHTQALLKRHYDLVYFLFARKHDCLHYQKLFAADEWPEYRYYPQTGKILRTAQTFRPDSITNLRKVFRFLHEPHPKKLASS